MPRLEVLQETFAEQDTLVVRCLFVLDEPVFRHLVCVRGHVEVGGHITREVLQGFDWKQCPFPVATRRLCVSAVVQQWVLDLSAAITSFSTITRLSLVCSSGISVSIFLLSVYLILHFPHSCVVASFLGTARRLRTLTHTNRVWSKQLVCRHSKDDAKDDISNATPQLLRRLKCIPVGSLLRFSPNFTLVACIASSSFRFGTDAYNVFCM